MKKSRFSLYRINGPKFGAMAIVVAARSILQMNGRKQTQIFAIGSSSTLLLLAVAELSTFKILIKEAKEGRVSFNWETGGSSRMSTLLLIP